MTSTEDGLLGQVERIIQSEAFKNSEGLHRLLRFLAEKSAIGEGDQLKEYTIGIDGLGKPSTYDPRHDAAVRIQVGRLRQKLGEYYYTEGKNDPILIELPKGHFKLIHETRPEVKPPEIRNHRNPALGWLGVGLAVSVAWGIWAAFLLNQPTQSAARADWTPELQELWRPFVSSDRPLIVMIADPLFVQFKGFGAYRSQVINTWEEAKASPSVATIRQALKDPEIERNARYTGVSEANASFVLSKLLSPHVAHLTLGRSSEFSWPLLANNNVIYVGAERIIAAQLQSLPVKFSYSYDYLGIVNAQPQPGEPPLFADPPAVNAGDASEDGESFALVSHFPGPAGQGEIATYTSNSAPARLAAVQWFTTPAGARDLMERMKKASGRIPKYYQVILRIKFKAGVPVETAYVRHRELETPAPAAMK
jgi:hypothetical protein